MAVGPGSCCGCRPGARHAARDRVVKVRYDEAEHAALAAAAGRAGLTVTGFLAGAGLAVAGQGPPPSQAADRELLAELARLRLAIRRYAVNVNQAVAVLHSTGDASMIGKVCQRGSDVRRLLRYLFREGRAGEHGLSSPHTDAHLIAAWNGLDGLGGAALTGRLAISAAEHDRHLTDEQWAAVVAEYVHRIGLAPRGDEKAVRWVAARHADKSSRRSPARTAGSCGRTTVGERGTLRWS